MHRSMPDPGTLGCAIRPAPGMDREFRDSSGRLLWDNTEVREMGQGCLAERFHFRNVVCSLNQGLNWGAKNQYPFKRCGRSEELCLSAGHEPGRVVGNFSDLLPMPTPALEDLAVMRQQA